MTNFFKPIEVEIKRPYTEHDIIESSPDILESSPDRKETSNESTSDDQDQQSISEDNSDNVSMDSALFEDQVFFDNSDTFDESALGDSEKLYPGSELTVIKCLALLFSWFCSSYVSKDSFSNLLHVLRNSILPHGNKLPSSYTEAYSIIKQLIVPVKQFDSCVNDCVVFKQCLEGSFENLTVCPKCSEPRFKKESSIHRKVFKYSGTSLIRSSKMQTPPSTGHYQESSCFCFVCFCQINLGGASGLVERAHGDYHTILHATLAISF